MTTPPPDDMTLLRTLATACGWKLIREQEAFESVFCIVDGQGAELARDSFNPERAWERVLKQAPAWLTSVDAALALPWPRDHEIEMHAWPNDYAFVLLHDPTGKILWDTQAKTLARALCEAFAAWWTATHQEAPTDVNDERRLP